MPARVPGAVRNALGNRGLSLDDDNNVRWDESASSHPKQWSTSRKLYDTGVLTLFITLSALLGNVGTSIAREASADLGINSVVASLIFASLFFYGQAVGGLFLPPYTETFGRKRTHIIASAGYAGFCAICGVKHVAAIAVGRFVCGFLSAVPTVVGSGSIEDMWPIRPRILAIDIWIKGSIVGIALGPCFATYIGSSKLGWPWAFWIGAIGLAAVSILFFWTKESRPNIIIQRQVADIRKTTNYDDINANIRDQLPSIKTFTTTMMIRPVIFFFSEPIVFAVTIMSATVFSSIYLITEGLQITYEEFGYTERQASLIFITWIIGLCLTIPLRILDWQIVSRRIQRKATVLPEDKITGFYVAAPILPLALWWFAWTVPPYAPNLSPFISLTSLVFVGACLNEFDGILQGYLTDAYTLYAASANAPLAFIRGLMSGSFPLFGAIMFRGLGSNISGSIMASIATVFCCVAFWFWKYNVRIRQNSSWATHYSD